MINCFTSLFFQVLSPTLWIDFKIQYQIKISFTSRHISEPEFYGDLVYKFKKIMDRTDFSDQFRKTIMRHTCIGYDLNAMRQSAC